MAIILVSSCLLGNHCRYDGGTNLVEQLEELRKYYDLLEFCPEERGGLSTPREPAEIRSDTVFTKSGNNVTKAYRTGADAALAACRYFNIKMAILKDRSPACGVYEIHNGHFDGKLIKGMGITAQTLSAAGIKVYSEADIPMLLAKAEAREKRREASKEKNEADEPIKTEAKPYKHRAFEGKREKPYAKSRKPSGFNKDRRGEDRSASKSKFGKSKPFGEKKNKFGPSKRKPFNKGKFGKKNLRSEQ